MKNAADLNLHGEGLVNANSEVFNRGFDGVIATPMLVEPLSIRIQTHERFKRILFIRTKHSMRMFRLEC